MERHWVQAKEMQHPSGAAALQQVPRDKPAPPQQQPLLSGKLPAKTLRGVQISASCQMVDLQSAASAVTQLKLETQAPITPVQTTSSRCVLCALAVPYQTVFPMLLSQTECEWLIWINPICARVKW